MAQNDSVMTFAKSTCPKHGAHVTNTAAVFDGPAATTYPYCPYCFGEWLEASFPVTPVEEA